MAMVCAPASESGIVSVQPFAATRLPAAFVWQLPVVTTGLPSQVKLSVSGVARPAGKLVAVRTVVMFDCPAAGFAASVGVPIVNVVEAEFPAASVALTEYTPAARPLGTVNEQLICPTGALLL